MSGGSRSRRVESTCPNLTKMGPSASSARRNRTARGSSSTRQKSSALMHARKPAHALVAEKELVEPVAEADGEDFQQSEQAHETILTRVKTGRVAPA